ncbi:MAG TPA: DUF3047 domain-containing protein [Bryobacteraceae bacterium]|nr:DUF3047 domain-containing protein [Bryobacteraceae bacterium]
MRRALILFTFLTLASLAVTPQTALVVLNPLGWRPGRLPDGWQVKVNHGVPKIATVQEGNTNYLDLKSHDSSYGLERAVDVDPHEAPYLTWKWNVKQLPTGGDFRHSKSDDQAAQVLVAFADRRVLSYIWDTTAPAGIMESASTIPLVHVYAVVCRSGAGELNRWLTEKRNLAEDYAKAYGRPAPRVRGIRLQINTQHTGTSAESCFSEVAFRSTPQS